MEVTADAIASTIVCMPDLSSEFPISETQTYLNTAAQGPWPARTALIVQQLATRSQKPPGDGGRGNSAMVADTQAHLGALLGVAAGDLVFGANTTHGLNICTHGIDWRAGDNIVLPEREFPSVNYALAHLPALGVEIRTVPWIGSGPESGPAVDQIMARVDARTRAVICSAIAWDTGYTMDLAALGARCAERGVLSIIDGIHAVAAEPLDLRALRLSAFAFHGYKWLMSGFGAGVLYVAPEAIDQIRPTFAGPLGVSSDVMRTQLPPAWAPGAQRFATGNDNFIGAAAMCASLTLIEEIGVPQIRAANHALADMLQAGIARVLPGARCLRSSEARHQSAIVVFTTGSPEGDAALVATLSAKNIVVALRPAGIRVSPHLFNTARDIEMLLTALV